MPKQWFKCPDAALVEIKDCLSTNGCRMQRRCATLPYLRLCADERDGPLVTPSSAGNGPRMIYLKAVEGYVIDPDGYVFATFGIAVHAKLSFYKYTRNVLAEEPLSDEDMKGIPDVLSEDEQVPGSYILYDYKTWGSYKAKLCLGIVHKDVNVIGDDGEPVRFKSGPRKGVIKTKKQEGHDPDAALVELYPTALQLNRYRIFFEKAGFPISHMRVQMDPRDSGTQFAKSRGVEKNIYMLDIERLPDDEVLAYYRQLTGEVNHAMQTGEMPRFCNPVERWNGNRCAKYCEVAEPCMAHQRKEGGDGYVQNSNY